MHCAGSVSNPIFWFYEKSALINFVRACVCLQGDSLADAETETDTAADRRQADEQYLCFDRSRPPACVPPSARQVPGAGPIARPVGVATAGRPVIVRPFVCSSLLLVLLGYFTASSSHTIAAHVERERRCWCFRPCTAVPSIYLADFVRRVRPMQGRMDGRATLGMYSTPVHWSSAVPVLIVCYLVGWSKLPKFSTPVLWNVLHFF